ncbi:MAG TPA: galactose-1-phosphate uridylyltransferase [Planctomycetaceae bacterium]|nr:galactose-1-phosphate uridylyltransferase [Planctomycetaceae bacterium]
MSEYRRDPLTGRWVIVAEERAARPHQFDIETNADDSYREHCPFCEGNESLTPGEVDAIRPPGSRADGPGWAVRVVPNRYPAVHRDPRFPDNHSFQSRYGNVLDVDTPLAMFEKPFYQPLPGTGAHEVLVDTPRHILSLTDMNDEEVKNVFRMYKRRLSAISKEKRFAHAMIFKNVGAAAGASLPHSHSQLLAMPFLPPPIQRELHRAIAFRRETDLCYWCEHLKHELKNKLRIVDESDHFVVLCPYVSRFPGEVAVFPKRHVSHYETLQQHHTDELGKLVRHTITLLEKLAVWIKGRLAYNIVLKSGPFVYNGPLDQRDMLDTAVWLQKLDYSFEKVYHFHVSILPSLAKAAGFEWGCGLHINPISPETAAQRLRDAAQSV